ncbi:LysE family translocator [Corynebacterium glyciniphilum]|uniref:LysE family translocator n=1 Tax=Corynebacterium glyciniphilum TaxID=1404244 RepID=UPI00264F1F3A|nr:LysE family translocator [Corynebacterium glyciniphilum]MDN5684757.1 LysE family translocator [Corynebacterium glyciniphilum]
MEATLVLQFAVTAALLTLVPGADWAYVITTGIRSRSVVPPVLGLASGYVLLVAAVAVGVGALVSTHPDILTVVTLVGACYIIYLGMSTLLSLRDADGSLLRTDEGTPADGVNGLRLYLRGMGVSGINPKAMLMLLVLLPQYLTPDGWSSTAQTGLLGSIFILEVVVIYFGVALFARSLLLGRPRLNTAVTVFSGVLLTGFGAWLLLDVLAF